MRALPRKASRSQLADPAVTRQAVERDQRQRILRGAADLIAKRGYHSTTIELISKRAGVGLRTFYKHFRSKEECFLTLYDRVVEITEERIRAALDDRPIPWPERIIVAMRTFVELILSDPMVARACIVEAPTVGPVMSGRLQNSTKALAPLFRAGREYGSRGDQLPANVEMTLAGSAIWSVYQRLIVGELDRIEELLPEVVELVLRPYLGEEEAARIARTQVGAISAR